MKKYNKSEALKKVVSIARTDGFFVLGYKILRYLYNYILDIWSKIVKKYQSFQVHRNSPIEYKGVTLPLDNGVFSAEVRSRFVTETYEQTEYDLLDQYISNRNDIVDLGASTGFLTVAAKQRTGPDQSAVAVEANPDLIPVLEETKRLNDAECEIIHAAYAPQEKTVEFHQHPLSVGGSVQRETDNSIQVSATSIERIASEFDLSQLFLIVDIEGGERELIENEMDLLTESCEWLIIEFHPFAVDVDALKEKVKDSTFNHVESKGNVVVYKNSSVSNY